MTDVNNEGTPAAAPEVQPIAAGTPAPGSDEVTTLRSRNAGLDAKVSELLKSAKAADEARQIAEKALADLRDEKVGADSALSARLAEKDAELAAMSQKFRKTAIEAKYPETFSVLGDSAISMSEDALAAAEARFKGVVVPEESDQPVPVGNNPQRKVSASPKAIEDMNLAELEEHLRTFDPQEVLYGSRR